MNLTYTVGKCKHIYKKKTMERKIRLIVFKLNIFK